MISEKNPFDKNRFLTLLKKEELNQLSTTEEAELLEFVTQLRNWENRLRYDRRSSYKKMFQEFFTSVNQNNLSDEDLKLAVDKFCFDFDDLGPDSINSFDIILHLKQSIRGQELSALKDDLFKFNLSKFYELPFPDEFDSKAKKEFVNLISNFLVEISRYQGEFEQDEFEDEFDVVIDPQDADYMRMLIEILYKDMQEYIE